MANKITKHIPNTVTCLNLFSGCVAAVMAFQSNYELAVLFIILSAVFDFFDGMLARALHAYSNIGKELDSLADDISFGFAPAVIVFSLFREEGMHYPALLQPLQEWIPYSAFLIAVFSGLRLAKFNVDERQTSSFIGVPTPANALFWGSLVIGQHDFLTSDQFNAGWLLILAVLFSWLLVAEIPMFSLKFKNLKWADNKIPFIFILVSIPLLIIFKIAGIAAVIGWYILLSLITQKKQA